MCEDSSTSTGSVLAYVWLYTCEGEVFDDFKFCFSKTPCYWEREFCLVSSDFMNHPMRCSVRMCSKPLNNRGLNSPGPLKSGFFPPINTQSAFGISECPHPQIQPSRGESVDGRHGLSYTRFSTAQGSRSDPLQFSKVTCALMAPWRRTGSARDQTCLLPAIFCPQILSRPAPSCHSGAVSVISQRRNSPQPLHLIILGQYFSQFLGPEIRLFPFCFRILAWTHFLHNINSMRTLFVLRIRNNF